MNAVGLILTIFVINIVYVSLSTVRIIMVMKSMRLLASSISIVEIFIYLMGLNLVLEHIDKPLNLMAYCLGWGSGVFLGSKIEAWLAMGYVTLEIVVESSGTSLVSALREAGYGVTSWLAEGRDGPRLVMQVLAKRSNERLLLRTINQIAPKAFIITYEPRFLKGGFWAKRVR